MRSLQRQQIALGNHDEAYIVFYIGFEKDTINRMKQSPIEVFNRWAEIGKDEGMADGHRSGCTSNAWA